MESNFYLRVISSIIIVLLALTVIKLGAWAFYIIILIITLLSYSEVYGMTVNKSGVLRYWGYIMVLVPNASLIYIYNYDRTIFIWMLIVIWVSDTAAYIFGKNVGGPLLAPSISPKKTQAGFIGGITCALLGGGVTVLFLKMHLSFILLSPIIAVTGVLGDLLESLFKRNCNKNESGYIIPGHGGILDRMDSFILVAPLVTLLLYNLYI